MPDSESLTPTALLTLDIFLIGTVIALMVIRFRIIEPRFKGLHDRGRFRKATRNMMLLGILAVLGATVVTGITRQTLWGLLLVALFVGIFLASTFRSWQQSGRET